MRSISGKKTHATGVFGGDETKTGFLCVVAVQDLPLPPVGSKIHSALWQTLEPCDKRGLCDGVKDWVFGVWWQRSQGPNQGRILGVFCGGKKLVPSPEKVGT